MIKEYIITGKGYFKTMVHNPFSIKMDMCDIKTSYGYIHFKGTKKQLNDFICDLIDNESTIKYITHYIKEEEESEDMFLNGVNFKNIIK